MTERKAKDVIDSFEKVGKLLQVRPTLPNEVLPSYIKMIDCIYELSKEGNVKVSDIATFFNQTRPSITRALLAMDELKLIKKVPSKEDKRVVYVSLTSKGLKLYDKYVSNYYKQLTKLLSKYDLNQINEMISTINSIYEDISNHPIKIEEK